MSFRNLRSGGFFFLSILQRIGEGAGEQVHVISLTHSLRSRESNTRTNLNGTNDHPCGLMDTIGILPEREWTEVL